MYNLNTIKRISLYLLLIFSTSCKKENAFDCFKSNGKEITEVRQPGAFTFIEAYDDLEVSIFQGPSCSVEVTAGEHVIDNILTKVEEGVLKLDNINRCNFVRGYKKKVKIKVTLPYVEQASNFGVGPMTLDENFNQEKIFVLADNSGDIHLNGTFGEIRTSSHGNGDMYLNGSTKILLIYSNGTNYTWAEDLSVSDYIFVSTYSIGDTFFNLNGVNKLDYYIWSDGNIYYKGTPGSINRLNEDVFKGKLIKQD